MNNFSSLFARQQDGNIPEEKKKKSKYTVTAWI